MVTVNVSAANQTEDKLTHSVSISGKSDITKLSPLVNAGTGYTDGTGLALIGGNGSGATVDITVHGNGTVSGVDIFDGGSEYKIGDSLSITNTNASGIKQVSIGSSGNAYPAGITSYVNTTSLSGSGTGLTLDVTGENGAVTAVAIRTDGSGYIQNETVQISGAGGGDATLNVDFIHGNSATLTVADANVNKDSDFIAYGIPLEVGGNAMYDDITLKAGDSIYVSSSEPGVSFTIISNTAYGNVNADVQKNLGRGNSYISSTAFPQINDNVGLVTAKYDGVATIHVSNRNSDKIAAVSVGIASGDISTFSVEDYFLFGQRLQPLQELKIDNIGIASGQTLVTRASKTDVAFAAYTRPIELQFAGVGTDGSVNTIGVITATAFVGDGTQITGVTAAGYGVSLTSNQAQRGVGAIIDFSSEFNVTNASAGVATVSAATVGLAETANYATTAAVSYTHLTLPTKA